MDKGNLPSFCPTQIYHDFNPVKVLPNFAESFTIETETSGKGIDVVLTQSKQPITFLNKSLSPKNQTLFVYDKEMFATLHVVEKWHHYIM